MTHAKHLAARSRARIGRRATAIAAAIALTSPLCSPSQALAAARIDQTELAQGDNVIGGGTATLTDELLDMLGVTAGELYTDEDLSVHFDGDNEIGDVTCAGEAKVDLSFTGENEVEEVHATEQSDVTINADGHNEFEEIGAQDSATLTINVTGENECEEIEGRDNAQVTIRGTECQRRDTLKVGDGEEDTQVLTENGTLTIDHVTLDVLGKEAVVGSKNGDMLIDTSKIASEGDNENLEIVAGGTLRLTESIIDITGTLHATGAMTIEHSDVDAEAPDDSYGAGPYRIWSEAGIELIRQRNGRVTEGMLDGKKVRYVDTDDGEEVHLRAAGRPAYYRCGDEGDSTIHPISARLPKTSDPTNPLPWTATLAAGITALLTGLKTRRHEA